MVRISESQISKRVPECYNSRNVRATSESPDMAGFEDGWAGAGNAGGLQKTDKTSKGVPCYSLQRGVQPC